MSLALRPRPKTETLVQRLERLKINSMYQSDFYWTWDKTADELEAVFAGDFLFGQKVTKKPLKKLRFLRIFLDYGGFLFTLRRRGDQMPISALTSLKHWTAKSRSSLV